jgi:hypothetical protein
VADPEARHQDCWYARRTAEIPSDLGFHTIVDGQLLFCSHTMWFPVVGYQFDVRNCETCDYFRARLPALRSAEGKPDTA